MTTPRCAPYRPHRACYPRRSFLAGGGALLSACGPLGSNQSGGSATASAGPLKDLVVGIPILRATAASQDLAQLGIFFPQPNIYERLFVMDDRFQLVPKLAERYEFRPPNTWRFFLRKGVTFHDGSPFTARDVIWTFDRQGRRGGSRINAVEGATVAVDDHAVDFTPSQPNTKVPWQLVDPGLAIMRAGSDPLNHPVGTGPFKFASLRADEFLKTERYDNYWDKPNAGRVASMLFKLIPDGNARILALKAGDIDLVQEVPQQSVNELKRDGRLKVVTSAISGFNAIYVNVRGQDEFALTADRRLREALARMVNQEVIVKEVYEGNAAVAPTLLPPTLFGPHRDKIKGAPPYDPNGARRILDELGWRPGPDGIRVKDGRRLELVLASGFPSADIQRPIPEFLQGQFRQAGIDVKIVEQSMTNLTVDGKLRLHLWLEMYGPADPDPAGAFRFYRSPAAGATGNYSNFGPGAAVDEPVRQSLAATDFARSQELAVQALNALISEECAVIPLAGTMKIWAMSRNVDFVAHPAVSQELYHTAVKR